MRHKLLARQIRRHFGPAEELPDDIRDLLDAVDEAYRQADEDRALLERSLETMSEELQERYDRLLEEQSRIRVLARRRELDAVFERAGVGVWVVDLDGKILQVNRALCDYLGMPQEALLGRASTSLAPPGDAPVTRDALARLVEGEEVSVEVRKRFVRADGEILTARLTLTLVRTEDGRPLYVMGVVQDITERERMGAALAEREEQLRQARRMESIGRLAGGVAHDFNNLLTVIRGRTELLLSALDEEDPNLADVREIHGAAERATGLTRQLLAFSRKQILRPEAVHPADVLDEVVPLITRLIGEDIVVRLDVAEGLPRVHADAAQLEQVLMNLAVNARDAMPGGGNLVFSVDHVEAHPGDPHLPAGSWVRLEVSDDGDGMSESVRELAFEPFFSTKEPGKGTGLGLAMAHGFVHQSSGRIHLESEPGAGTTVVIHLPALGSAPGERDRADRPERPPRPRARAGACILLVEDDDAVRRLVVGLLRQGGHDVVEARDGDAAVAAHADLGEQIDLVLLDVVMPGANGVDVAARLTRQRPDLPVLFMTGYTDEEIVRRGLSAPATRLISKPFTGPELLAAIDELLAATGPASEP